MPATCRFANARPMHSRSYRRRRRCASRMPRAWRRASRSAASRCGRGARARRKASWPANGRMPHCSRAPPRRRSRRRSPRATTASRSSSRGGASCAPSPSPQPARRSVCPPCRHPRSPPFPEMSSMPEIALTRAPAHVRHGSNIGQPLTRRDGVLKVTGAARYAADQHPPGMLYAVLAVSSVARGRVAFIDVAAAKAHPGVVAVITPANRPALAQDPDAKTNPFMFRLDLLQSDRVRYANQPIAVVVAETLEAATEGAALLSPRYDSEPARIGLDAAESFVPPGVGVGNPAEVHRGDVEAGLAAASKRIAATYETAPQYHNAMEPHAIVAAWDGDALSIDTPSQALVMAQGRIAELFGIPPDKIHIRSPFLGGGFGSKGFISGPQILGIIAARVVGKPVKLVLRREQMYGPVGHRAPTRQALRMGADGGGKLTALDHHTKTTSSTFDDFFEPASDASHTLYASPAIATSHEGVRVDTGTPLFMRAPGEATGSIALESAIDEMAQACGMDPLALRLKNYAEVEPISGKPFSSKALRECYAQGARQFGWERRPLAPRQMRDDDGLLVGWGVGTATFPALMFQAQAKAVLRRDGGGVMEIGAHDMGQGAWTALAQIAADG